MLCQVDELYESLAFTCIFMASGFYCIQTLSTAAEL